jgi:hypothetical protein
MQHNHRIPDPKTNLFLLALIQNHDEYSMPGHHHTLSGSKGHFLPRPFFASLFGGRPGKTSVGLQVNERARSIKQGR